MLFDDEKSEGGKYKALVDFLFSNMTEGHLEIYSKEIVRKSKYNQNPSHRVFNKDLEKITPDSRISDSQRYEFVKQIKRVFETGTIVKGKIKQDIIPFVHKVRNNIFHGTKTTKEMVDPSTIHADFYFIL